MAKHTYFEDLCALAPVGELSPSQLRELEAHIVDCDSCRQSMLDYDRILRQILPAAAEPDEEYVKSRGDDLHASVLRGMEEIDRQRELVAATATPVAPGFFGFHGRGLLFALSGGAGTLALAATTFYVGAHFYGQPSGSGTSKIGAFPVPSSSASPAAKPSVNSTDHATNVELVASLDAERQHSADLANKLSTEDGQLAKALADANALHTQFDSEVQALTATKAELDSTRAELDSKRTQLERLQASRSTDAATVASLELEVKDLTTKLGTENASLDRERDLLSHGREIRDIIGARNLHIIDVYDTGMEGETRKPFARAFYTEGKSLVYMAYDLPQRRADDGKFSYVAWGEANGNKATIKKIGILFHDDQTQRRWSLNFADPQVLREIDSVFITLEKNDDGLAQPKGKRMLTAYLGMPANHP